MLYYPKHVSKLQNPSINILDISNTHVNVRRNHEWKSNCLIGV